MLKQLAFLFDPTRCINCYSCEIACKQENALPPLVDAQPGTTGPRWRRVITLEEGVYPDARVWYISMTCMHCGDPDCMKSCPSGAISKRAEDGIVVRDAKKCVGCRFCSWACRFGAPQFGADGHMEKCNLCIGLLEKGELPACVASCTGGAIQFGTVDEISQKVRGRAAMKLAGATDPQFYLLAAK
jgi:DMSO reductase iron-sulfur subunit